MNIVVVDWDKASIAPDQKGWRIEVLTEIGVWNYYVVGELMIPFISKEIAEKVLRKLQGIE